MLAAEMSDTEAVAVVLVGIAILVGLKLRSLDADRRLRAAREAEAAAPRLVTCPDCGAEVSRRALSCPQCGAPITTAAGNAPVSRTTAGMLAIFLGGLGVHKFYLSKPGQGFLYLVFCWTFIPAIAGVIEGITILNQSDAAFQAAQRTTQ